MEKHSMSILLYNLVQFSVCKGWNISKVLYDRVIMCERLEKKFEMVVKPSSDPPI